ncbi:MAG: sterol desaturase family protein [Paracoccaceae bacterium]
MPGPESFLRVHEETIVHAVHSGLILLPGLAAVLCGIADAAISVFGHSNTRLPEKPDRVLSRRIGTPHLHRGHHSTVRPETNSNFGATLPFWDMAFGTYPGKSANALATQPVGLDEMQDSRA